MQTDLIKLAGTHLGKAGDGSLVKPYVTPDKHDKTLLVPLPRNLNREKSNIQSANSFTGFEVWHAYEMSFLTKTGMPATGVLKLHYPATSYAMVESKSLKLYLNSFDLEKFESVSEVEQVIREDLSQALQTQVEATLHLAHEADFAASPFVGPFVNVDDNRWVFTEYKENPDLLEITKLEKEHAIWFHTSNLRSNCEITNQKDTGNCYIYIKGTKLPTWESLTKYVVSFRDSQHFHENVTEIMYEILTSKCSPEELLVANIYNRRGGIDIHSVRASKPTIIAAILKDYHNTQYLFDKTPQQ